MSDHIIGKEYKESFEKLFIAIYKNNTEAIALSFSLLEIAHVWDDLIDKDREVSAHDINKAFVAATIDLSINPLWGEDLAFNLLNVYIRWQDANSIELDKDSTDNALSMAWMLRAGIYDMFILIAVKLHGLDWGLSISPQVRIYYGEPLTDFIKEIRHA